MHNALFLLADWVNFVRGGVRLSATDQRRLEILSVDDASKNENVEAIYKALVAGRVGGRAPDFLLGPYSSGLTEVAAKIANQNGALLMAPGASATSIFKNRTLSFGMLDPADAPSFSRCPSVHGFMGFGLGMFNPAETYLHASVSLLHQLGVKSIAFLFEDATATKDWCKGAVTKAQALNMTIAVRIQVSQKLNVTQISSALENFTAASPDAVVGCTQNFDVCANFLRQAATNSDLKFYARAMLFTTCVSDPRFPKELSSLAWHVLGASPWSELDPKPDEQTGWSPADFARRYASAFGQTPPYQGVAAFAGGLLLVNAIEKCGSLDPKLVANELKRTRLRTVYGDIAFDQNRQNVLPFVTVQYAPSGNQSVVTAGTVLFPMPSWAARDCEFNKRCEDRGGCRSDGTCKSAVCKGGYFKLRDSDGDSCRNCSKGYMSPGGTASACTMCPPGAPRCASIPCYLSLLARIA
jgi:ABC-type branched-subunit amino acid transport system substrate-binding protein